MKSEIQSVTNGSGVSDRQVERLVALGRALSDPIRVRMLGLMTIGRGCCNLPELDVPEEESHDTDGICVCEFMAYYELAQSKVSYHLGKLKNAGLVSEERRGKWSFYSVDKETVRELVLQLTDQLGLDPLPEDAEAVLTE